VTLRNDVITASEPPEVRDARRVLRAWELRSGHASYVECLDGGYRGYQARCWDCEWQGPEHLRGDEQLGSPESCAHKRNARADAAAHQTATRPGDWHVLAGP
jgi:hypothetical protein